MRPGPRARKPGAANSLFDLCPCARRGGVSRSDLWGVVLFLRGWRVESLSYLIMLWVSACSSRLPRAELRGFVVPQPLLYRGTAPPRARAPPPWRVGPHVGPRAPYDFLRPYRARCKKYTLCAPYTNDLYSCSICKRNTQFSETRPGGFQRSASLGTRCSTAIQAVHELTRSCLGSGEHLCMPIHPWLSGCKRCLIRAWLRRPPSRRRPLAPSSGAG